MYLRAVPRQLRPLSFPKATTLSCLLFMTTLNLSMLKGSRQGGAVEWGRMTARSQYALIMLATEFTLDDGLDGIHPLVGPPVLARQ